MFLYWFTTVPGLESYAINELRRVSVAHELDAHNIQARAGAHRGRVELSSPHPPEFCWPAFKALRCVFYVYLELGERLWSETPSLAEIREIFQELPLKFHGAASFCVRAKRRGQHDFTSETLEREVGAVIKGRFALPVSLKQPDYLLSLELDDTSLRFSRQLNLHSLNLRNRKVFQPAVTLKPVLAALMLEVLDLRPLPGQRLLDPFCGAGTLLFEAAQRDCEWELIGSDRHAGNLRGAEQNARALGLQQRIRFVEQDARDLDQHWPEGSFQALVTDPPLGKQLGEDLDFYRLYEGFLASAAHLLQDRARLVILTGGADALFRKHLQRQALFQRLWRGRIELGTHAPWIYLLERQPRSQSLT